MSPIRYWLRGNQGAETALDVAEDGTVAGTDLKRALRESGYGPWTVIDRRAGVRYLGLIDRTIVSQSGTRLCDVDRPNGMRFQLLGQLLPLKEA